MTFRYPAVFVVALGWSAGTAAATNAHDSVPLPRERPEAAAPPVPDAKPAGIAVPLPRERPQLAAAQSATPPSPEPAEPPKPREKPAAEAATGTQAAPVPQQKPDRPSPPVPDEKPATPEAAGPPLPEEKPAIAEGPPLPVDKPAPEDGAEASDGGPDGEASAEESAETAPPPPPVRRGPPQGPPQFADDTMSPACPAIEEGRVSGRPLKPIEDLAGCAVPAVYAVSSVGSERAVSLTPEAELNCEMTARLDAFVEEVVEPAARDILKSDLAGLGIAGSYVCRTRNGEPGAAPSEHGQANAIDIATFTLADGRTVSVAGDWGAESEAGAFLRRVHEKACGPFTTVIGPDGDAYHRDHFHLDLQKRGADGRATFCQ